LQFENQYLDEPKNAPALSRQEVENRGPTICIADVLQ
jgi:hypothetical protein